VIAFTIKGEAASKSNSRRLVTIKGKPAVIKSSKAAAWEASALRQIPKSARVRLEGDICITLRMFYRTGRPDLDESHVLDVLQDRWVRGVNRHGHRILVQDGVYRNDRQIKEKHVFHGIDKLNPRVEVEVWLIAL